MSSFTTIMLDEKAKVTGTCRLSSNSVSHFGTVYLVVTIANLCYRAPCQNSVTIGTPPSAVPHYLTRSGFFLKNLHFFFDFCEPAQGILIATQVK